MALGGLLVFQLSHRLPGTWGDCSRRLDQGSEHMFPSSAPSSGVIIRLCSLAGKEKAQHNIAKHGVARPALAWRGGQAKAQNTPKTLLPGGVCHWGMGGTLALAQALPP